MKKQILIIEDCNINSDILREMLKDKYDVFVVTTGKMAIKMIEIKKPNLVLLDLGLPDMHGFDILKMIKSNSDIEITNIPVIITTADTLEASELEGLKLGASDYIFKPYNEKIIEIKIKNQFEIVEYKNNLEILVETKTKELTNTYNILVTIMSLLVNERDNDTGEHITKVQRYIDILFRNIDKNYIKNLSKTDIEYIISFSPIHDIGKISTLDSILLKPTSLTSEEFEKMKYHTIKGGKVLKKTKELFGDLICGLNFAIEMAECHHEKFDGTGYPYGLKGEDIPLSARFVTLCDIYDALTSERYYKKAYTHNQACEIIINGDGRTKPCHFDPYVLDAFIISEREFEKISVSNNYLAY